MCDKKRRCRFMVHRNTQSIGSVRVKNMHLLIMKSHNEIRFCWCHPSLQQPVQNVTMIDNVLQTSVRMFTCNYYFSNKGAGSQEAGTLWARDKKTKQWIKQWILSSVILFNYFYFLCFCCCCCFCHGIYSVSMYFSQASYQSHNFSILTTLLSSTI